MHTSPEITLDMTAEDLLQAVSDETCFEVDDIAALDPIDGSAPASGPAPAPTHPSIDTSLDADSIEMELSVDDMNAMFETTLPTAAKAE